MHTKKANVQYALLNTLYYSITCAMVGFASVFLLDKGLSNTTIGFVLAGSSILAIFGQAFLAAFLDKSKKINQLSLMVILLGFIIFGSLLINVVASISMTAMVIMLAVIYSLSTMLMPFINSLTFVFEERGILLNYGVARGLGSAAYATMSLGLGYFVNLYSPRLLPLFYIGLAAATLGLILSIKLPKAPERTTSEVIATSNISIKEFFQKYSKLIPIFLAVALLFFDHALVSNFLIHVIKHVGGNEASMGNALFIQAMIELPTLFLFSRIQKKIDNNKLLAIAAIFFSVKHILTYFAVNMTMFYMIMMIQLVTNALFVPASVYFIAQAVEATDLNKGQALMAASTTLGSVLSGLIGGSLYDNLSVSNTLLIGAIVSTIGTVIMLYGLKQFSPAPATKKVNMRKRRA